MSALVTPMMVMIGWMILLTFWLAWARVGSIARGKVDAKEFAKTGVWPHAWIRNAGDNYNNQFEVPVLFFVVCLLLMHLDAVTGLAVIVAWAFVASRIAHSLVQLTRNVIPLRFFVFLFGVICVVTMFGIAVGAALALST